MTEILLESNNTAKSPFVEEIEVANFYGGAGRSEMLAGLREAISDNNPLLIITGEEGCGKSMLCHKLMAEQLQAVSIFFPQTVDSFDGVVRSVAKKLDIESNEDNTSRSIDEDLTKITDCLIENSDQLLLIFDEAENIYLATLERIRKMVDRVTEAGAKISILFSGRRTFLENYEQLSICEFINDDELQFFVAPLTESDLAEYLAHCSRKIDPEGDGRFFSDEVLTSIYEIGKGNFRMTNILAEEAVKNVGDGAKFEEIIEEKIIPEVVTGTKKTKSIDLRGFVEQYKSYLPWAGALCCCLLLVGYFLIRQGDESVTLQSNSSVSNQTGSTTQEVGEKTTTKLKNTVPIVIKKVEPVVVRKESVAPPSIEPIDKLEVQPKPVPLVVRKIEQLPQEKIIERPIESVNLARMAPLQKQGTLPQIGKELKKERKSIAGVDLLALVPVKKVGQTFEDIKIVEQPIESVNLARMVPLQKQETLPQIGKELEKERKSIAGVDSLTLAPAKEVEQVFEDIKIVEQPPQPEQLQNQQESVLAVEPPIVELYRSPYIKKKPGTKVVDRPTARVIQIQPRNEVQDVIASNAHFTVNQLLEKRLLAGAMWESGQKNNMYTVQIMVLTSKGAEDNLKKMLAQPRYRQEAGNFYIFKKEQETTQIFVFYGEYPSITRARLAQNSLPQFLRDHKPYAISIKGATNKLKR